MNQPIKERNKNDEFQNQVMGENNHSKCANDDHIDMEKIIPSFSLTE